MSYFIRPITKELGKLQLREFGPSSAFFLPLARKSCLPRDRAPGMEAESTSGGSKERFFSSVYRAYMFFSIQENRKRHDSHARFHDFADRCSDLSRAIKDIQRSWRRPWSRGRSVIASGRRLVRRARLRSGIPPEDLRHHLPDEEGNHATRRRSVRLHRTSRGGLRTTASSHMGPLSDRDALV